MTVIVSFCSVFSIRLGSILVGALCLVQAAVLEAACVVGLRDVESVSRNLNEFMYEKDLLFLAGLLNSVRRNPEPYLMGTLLLLLAYSFSCILLVFGALKLNAWLVVPFVMLEFARLCASMGALVTSMLILKKNSNDLGPLMGGCTGGGFFMLLMAYMWMCPLSLAQELLHRKARGRVKAQQAKAANVQSLVSVLDAKMAFQHTAHTARLPRYPYVSHYPPTYPIYID